MLVVATEQIEDDPPTRIVGWACEGCGQVGAITLREYWDTWGTMKDVEADHAIVSPDCTSIEQYPKK